MLLFFVFSFSIFAQLQNEDFATVSQMQARGLTSAQAREKMLHDSKIWITANSINKLLNEAISDGDIGAGVTNAQNLVDRSDFERGALDSNFLIEITGPTNTSNFVTRTSQATPFNVRNYRIDSSLASGLRRATFTYNGNFNNVQMIAYCEIATNREGVKFYSRVNGNDVDSLDVIADGVWRYYQLPFVGGNVSNGFKIEVPASVGSGHVDFDNCFVGKAYPDIRREVSGAIFVGQLTRDGAAGCEGDITNTTFTSFSANTACATPTTIGGVLPPPAKTPSIRIANARTDGFYKVEFNIFLWVKTNGNCDFRLVSGSQVSNELTSLRLWSSGAADRTRKISSVFRFNTPGPKDIDLQAVVQSDSATCGYLNVVGRPFVANVYFYPDQNSTIVTQDSELNEKTANEFVAFVSSTGVVSGENFDWIDGDCSNAVQSVCNFKPGIFKDPPVCIVINGTTGGIQSNTGGAQVHSISNSSMTLVSLDSSNNPAARDKTVRCTRSLDYRKSASVVGRFENIKSQDLVRVNVIENNGISITADVTNVSFTNELEDNYNAWNTTFLTAPRDSFYLFTGSIRFTTSAQRRVDIYVNGIRISACGAYTGADTIHAFSCVVRANKNDSVSLRVSVNGGTLNSLSTHALFIAELPDIQSVVKNLSDQKTKCQTKILSTNVSSSGVVSSISYNNLTIGKKYELKMQVSANSGLVVSLRNGTNVLARIATVGSSIFYFTTGVFTAQSTTADVRKDDSVTMIGDGSRLQTWTQLCEYPDSYVETNEFN